MRGGADLAGEQGKQRSVRDAEVAEQDRGVRLYIGEDKRALERGEEDDGSGLADAQKFLIGGVVPQ